MKSVSAQDMRALDARTINEFGIPGEVLMDTAGRGVAEHLYRRAEMNTIDEPVVAVLAGKGNNGGDGFVAARYLAEEGIDVEVWLAASSEDITGDALEHLKLMLEAGVELHECETVEDWRFAEERISEADILLDALLGTGFSGTPHGPIAEAICLLSELADNCLVIAVDIPSGLNADTGEAAGPCVVADLTVTIALPKHGLLTTSALPYVGNLEVVDIGIPPEYVEPISSHMHVISALDVANCFVRRRHDDHKGRYGHVLIIGGAAGYTGAPVLAAQAALRSGVGLVTLLVPQSLVPAISSAIPEAMVHGGPENESGSLAADALVPWLERLESFSAVAAGPGMTTHADTRFLVDTLVERAPLLILDADALNVLADDSSKLSSRTEPVILTPHPGEMARLCGCAVNQLQAARVDKAIEFADKTNAIVVLKGSGTLVVEKGERPRMNVSGNPGMACGGMGDVLTGLMAGFAAQDMDPVAASQAAVYIHGRAGDLTASEYTMSAMNASDVIDEIPMVMRELCVR